MHVGVIQPVDDQRTGLELIRLVDQVGRGIPFGVPGGGTHVALGVDRVIVLPVGGRGSDHPCLEHLRRVDQGIERHIAAERLAVAANPAGIDEGQRLQVLDAGQLVVQGGLAQFPGDRRFEGMPATETTPVVQPPDDKASLGIEHIALDMIEKVGGTVAVRYQLQRGAGVPVDNHRILLLRVEILRLDDLGVQVHPIAGLDGDKLARDLGQVQRRPCALC